VLAGLTDKLVSPEAVAVAVRAYAEETNRQNHERRAQVEASRRALGKIEKGIKGILDAIEDGMYQPAMKARMSERQQQKAEIEARLAEAPIDLPDVHPNIARALPRQGDPSHGNPGRVGVQWGSPRRHQLADW
jgi:hypothetical protein